MQTREEPDTMGVIKVPAEVLWEHKRSARCKISRNKVSQRS